MSHEQATAELRKRIGQTTALLHQCKAQDWAITEGATNRARQVESRLAELRRTAITDPAAANEYMELTKEKGALLRTLAKS
jgi:hypothetical protein